MRPLLWMVIATCLQFAPLHPVLAEEPPERELLQMMELLQDWEMIQNLELMKQLDLAGQVENTSVQETTDVPEPQIQIEDVQRWNGNSY